MKTKKLIAFVLLFISFRSNSQYFNNFIPNYNSNWDNTQTITKNAMNEIIFLSVNLNSTTYPRDFELVKLDRAGNYLLSKRVLDSFGTLRAISIIPTYDTGYIVTGVYQGAQPIGYPRYYGSLHTTFYAKFDNNFNLLWFKLHYGFPQNAPNTINATIEPAGLIAVPGSPVEDYIVCNFGRAYDTIIKSNVETILLDKIDENGNLLTEVRPSIPTNYKTYPCASINYLPINNLCAITGGYYDVSLPPFAVKPFVMTFDVGLSTVNNFTSYSSTFGLNTPSNIVEDQANPNNILFFCFSTNTSPYPFTCNGSLKVTTLTYFQTLASNPSTILTTKGLTTSCMRSVGAPLTIKNTPGEPDNMMLGFQEVSQSGTGGIFRVPTLVKLRNDGTAITAHQYNNQLLGKFPYFENYASDSFILHINVLDSPVGSRIIKTDINGHTFCDQKPVVQTFEDTVSAWDTSIVFIPDSTILVDDQPTLIVDSFPVVKCDTFTDGGPDAKPNTNLNSTIPVIEVYPNPAHDALRLRYTGVINDRIRVIVSNTIGQKVIDQCFSATAGNENTVDVSQLTPGLYIFSVYIDSTLIKMTKLVIN